MNPGSSNPPIRPRAANFQTTAWSIVVRAGTGSPTSRTAFTELYQAYWQPLHAFLCRLGTPTVDAEDRLQSFFAWLLENNIIGRADPQRGRFRSFLLTALKQFVARQHQHDHAAKRRPDHPVASLHVGEDERNPSREPFHTLTPERLFDYSWAMTVLDRSMQRLGAEWHDSGKGQRFEVLKRFLTGPAEANIRDAAGELSLNEGAIRVAVHRIKQRYGEILREEVGQTVEESAEINDELGYLMDALRL